MSAVAGTEVFEAERSRLTGLAYRMLGTLSDAEDVVQQAWLRWSEAEQSEIANPAAWLTTVVSRLAIDRLRQQQRRREEYVGPWLPEPLATPAAGPSPDATDPEHAAELADSVTFGFLVLLDRLSPVERAVFVLSEVFGEPHTAIAEVIGKTPAATRQIASRARRRIREQRADRRPADEGLLAELVGALAEGAVERVLSLMSPEVVLTSDGGPARRAARRPIVGADRVTRFILNLSARTPLDAQITMESVNGAAALVIRSEELSLVMNADTSPDGERLDAIRLVLNPDKLGGLDHPVDVT